MRYHLTTREGILSVSSYRRGAFLLWGEHPGYQLVLTSFQALLYPSTSPLWAVWARPLLKTAVARTPRLNMSAGGPTAEESVIHSGAR